MRTSVAAHGTSIQFRLIPTEKKNNMDYMMFNMRTWSFLCVRYTHGGSVGTPTATSQHNIFDSEKLSQSLCCAPDAGGVRTSGLWISESGAPATEPPRHPATPGQESVPWLVPRRLPNNYGWAIQWGIWVVRHLPNSCPTGTQFTNTGHPNATPQKTAVSKIRFFLEVVRLFVL